MSIPSSASSVTDPRSPPHDKAWWRHPMLWLVIGGPVVVVVASVITAVIAVRGADPVLSREPASSSSGAEGDQRTGDLTPAVQARNHAATPKP